MTYQLILLPHHISNPGHYFSQKTKTNEMAWLIQNKQENKNNNNKNSKVSLVHKTKKGRTRKHHGLSAYLSIFFGQLSSVDWNCGCR